MVVLVNKKPNKATFFQFRYGSYRAAYLFRMAKLNSSIWWEKGVLPARWVAAFLTLQTDCHHTGQVNTCVVKYSNFPAWLELWHFQKIWEEVSTQEKTVGKNKWGRAEQRYGHAHLQVIWHLVPHTSSPRCPSLKQGWLCNTNQESCEDDYTRACEATRYYVHQLVFQSHHNTSTLKISFSSILPAAPR